MKRRLTQLVTSILANSYLTGFFRGHIYRGPLKALCVPFLNCYSCPGAWGTCPMGAFQALAAGFSQTLSFYIMGLLTTLGALGGPPCLWLALPLWFLSGVTIRLPEQEVAAAALAENTPPLCLGPYAGPALSLAQRGGDGSTIFLPLYLSGGDPGGGSNPFNFTSPTANPSGANLPY